MAPSIPSSHIPARASGNLPPSAAFAVCGTASTACRGTASFEIGPDPGRIQLFPAGFFSAGDGRPGNMEGVAVKEWRCSSDDAGALISAWLKLKCRLVVDYEHQTLHCKRNGQPAPAAGWITSLSFVEEKGLFATVEWTERARAFIRAGEYKYISPVFTFDKKTGAVTGLHSAALTNKPALDGMEPASARQEDSDMDKELRESLGGFFGLGSDAADADILAAVKKREKPLADLDAAIAARDEAHAREPDPEKFVPAELFMAEREKSAALAKKVEELEKGSELSALDAEITAALADGRLPKSCEAWARHTAKTLPETMRMYLKSAVSVAALTRMQSQDRMPESRRSGLSDEEVYACRAAGIEEKDFLAARAREEK